LLQRIKNPTAKHRTLLLEPQLVWRESVRQLYQEKRG
ncbi:RbsR, partial [Pasteurella multocida subsp. multocida str. Anand1_cattle]